MPEPDALNINQANSVGLRISVQDTGIGIDTSAQERLFKKFEQLDASSTREFGGTGLGLAISKHLVTLMDGRIGVESIPNKGSLFWFSIRLPILPSTQDTVIINDNFEQRLRKEFTGATILVAEDEPINREIFQELLDQAGLIVMATEDGAKAIELAQEHIFDLALIDLQMPVLGGIETTRILRTLPGWADVPILAVTANVFEEDRQLCLNAGMNDHIPKPIPPEALYAAIYQWLRRHLHRET
jgi:CheY-like chemotaxis protein